MNAKELAALAEDLHAKKAPLNSLHQEIAENFYPERADFTVKRPLGTDFAANLMTSYPVVCRRDLGDQFGTMLRPTATPWFTVARKYAEKTDTDVQVREYLEWFGKTMRNAMYDKPAMFTRATKEGDHDFASFGQTCISVELNRKADGLLYRCWHLRDLAWQEDAEGQIGFIARKWKPTMATLAATFGKDKLDPKQVRLLSTAPFEEANIMHMVVPAEMYDEAARGMPRWSIFWDVDNARIIEARPIWGKHYVIPRWQTVSSSMFGSQYSYSPAVIAALPDARLIQAMTFTLLEVGEKAANPPLIATKDAVRSDVAVFAGGITWVDKEYDERLGEVLRPISQDFRGFNYGLQMAQDTRQMIHKAFYLDALTMPERAREMTAYEVGQRVQQYIRNALPIFEPMEQEYNAALCDETFDLMMRAGAFGSPDDWPKKLRGTEVDFKFESPLHEAIEQQKGQKWQEASGLISSAIPLDQSTAFILDTKTALRDALAGVGVPAAWLNDEEEVKQMVDAQQQQQQQQQMLSMLEQGSSAAANMAGASKDMAQAQNTMAAPV